MKATVHLVEPEEAYPVEIDGRDRRAFEREGKIALGFARQSQLADVIRSDSESYMLWLAWHAATRVGTVPPWPDFESRAVVVESEDDQELVPTIATATAD